MDYIDDDKTNSKKSVLNLRQSGRGKLIYSTGFLHEKTNNSILNTVQQNMKIWLDVSYPVWWGQSEEGDDRQSGVEWLFPCNSKKVESYDIR